MKDEEIYLEQLSTDFVKFGDIIKQFGGLDDLKMYKMINYIHKHYVNKKVKMYLNLNGENQIRIFYVKKFLIEISTDGNYDSHSFKFRRIDGGHIIVDAGTNISILIENKSGKKLEYPEIKNIIFN
jgi:hypothetical protein